MRQRFARNLILGLVTLVGASLLIVGFVSRAPGAGACLPAHALMTEPPISVAMLVELADLAVIARGASQTSEERGSLTHESYSLEVGEVVAASASVEPDDLLSVVLGGTADKQTCEDARFPPSR